jgi:hypothetical protein
MTVGTKDAYRRAAYVGPPRMRSNAVGGGGDCTLSLAWEDLFLRCILVILTSNRMRSVEKKYYFSSISQVLAFTVMLVDLQNKPFRFF